MSTCPRVMKICTFGEKTMLIPNNDSQPVLRAIPGHSWLWTLKSSDQERCGHGMVEAFSSARKAACGIKDLMR